MADLSVAAGAVGLQSGAPSGSNYPFAQGSHGAMVSQPLGKYYDAVVAGRVFYASNTAAQAISVALSTTYTGICLANPASSGKNISLLRVGAALSVAPAAIAGFYLIGNYSETAVTHTTPLTPASALIGGGFSPVGKVDREATIPTPLYLQSLFSGFTAGALPGGTVAIADIDGGIVLKPGAFVALGSLTAATGIFSFLWAEETV